MALEKHCETIKSRISKIKYVIFFYSKGGVFVLLWGLVFLFAACKPKQVGTFDRDDWEKPALNPVLSADSTSEFVCPVSDTPVYWEKADVFNCAAIVHNGKIAMLYRAEDNKAAGIGGRTSRIGLAFSTDGTTFERMKKPVLFPDKDAYLQYEYPGGCEDPRIVAHPDGGYLMTYTAWNGKTARLSVATSKDLNTWTKHGPVFAKAGQQWLDMWSKSGAIVCKLVDKRPVPKMLDGKYWMYWGDNGIFAATSTNLTDWTPFVDDFGNLIPILSPRKRRFDSGIVEPGPPALVTGHGIELIYNGKNADDPELADARLPPGMYSIGLAIFQPEFPSLPVQRSMAPFIRPTLPHELTGQYKSGTTFAEALVPFNGKWWLYYGTADSYVGVAMVKK